MSTMGLRSPPSLYSICLDLLIPLVERVSEDHDWDEHSSGPLDKFAAAVLEDLLLQTYHRATAGKSQAWSDDWKVLITPKSQSLVLAWDQNLLRFVNSRCKAVKQILVGRWKRFSPASLNWLPASVVSVDFDGELFYRGRQGPSLNFSSNHVSPSSPLGWLQEAEAMLKGLYVWRQKSILNERNIVPSGSGDFLLELHLGAVPGVTAEDLVVVLRSRPGLRLLRHYQLLTALKLLHGDAWRNGERLPKYRLRNLDMDFSHVVRCRMSPEAVLPADVLQLGVLLCPDVTSVRVRFDPLTSHDVLSPLATMLSSGLRELSVVCVTSGEKSRLDFFDLVPIFEKHGPESLRSLELKVMEDVDVHVIAEMCPKLERLVLSGCGNVMPPTCSNGRCDGRSVRRLKRLKLLFFADGDDFSWDHAVPQCFWKSTLGAGGKKKVSHSSRLEGIFLESPRIPSAIADEIFRPGAFPALQVLSLCRYPELRMQDVAGICGLDLNSYGAGGTSATSQKDSGGPPRYVRLTDCEQVGPRQERILRNMLKHAYPLQEVRLVIS